MRKEFRRVVTGHDDNGKAVVLSDGPAPFVHVNPADPDWYSADIWRTTETPAKIVAKPGEPTLGPRRQMPDKRGSVIRILARLSRRWAMKRPRRSAGVAGIH
jgi:hypothetical protein